MNNDEIKRKLLEKNFRLFNDKYKILLLSKGYNKANNKGNMMEGYVAMSYFGKDFGKDIDKYRPGILGHDEQGIDFIFIQDKTLNIITSKSGNNSYSNLDIDKLYTGLKTCYGESTTENTILNDFIKNENFKEIENINIYYFCENGNKGDIGKTLIENSIDQIKKYDKPKEYCSNFKNINIVFINYEDVYINEKQIKIFIPIDNQYFFSYNGDRICIARVNCEFIKNIVQENGENIFERNIRGELGGKINFDIKNTLESDPGDFFLFNNGITIIGNKIEKDNTSIIIENAQIVNGQQTSWTIESIKKLDNNAYILCRFFEIKEQEKVRKITQTTNTQNSTDFRDFVANDEIQEAIEQYFYEKEFFYERKVSRKKIQGFKGKLTNIELAQSTLAIILGFPSKITTPRKEVLFTDNKSSKGEDKGFYTKIFSKDIKEMDNVFFNIFLQCKKQIKKQGNDLKNKGWLHIGRIWYKKQCKNFEEAFKIFEKFADKYGIEKEIKLGKNPLNRNETDKNLEKFLK